MADVSVNVEVLAQLSDAITQFNKFQKSIDKGFKKNEKSSKGFVKSLKDIGKFTTGILAADLIKRGFSTFNSTLGTAVSEARRLESALTGLRAVAAATGTDMGFIESTAKDLAADGLIPLTEVSASLKNLLATGLSGEEAVRTFENLRDAAAFNRQGTLSLGQAIEGATQGIKNQNSIMVDNAGITRNLSLMYADYAEQIGKTAKTLTDQEKAQAAVLGIAKEARTFQGNYNLLLQTFDGAISKVSGSWQIFLATVGESITKNKTVVATLLVFSDALKDMVKAFNLNKKEVREFVTSGINYLIGALELTLSVVDYAVRSIKALGLTVKGTFLLAEKAYRELRALVGKGDPLALEQVNQQLSETGKALNDAFQKQTLIGKFGNKVSEVKVKIAETAAKMGEIKIETKKSNDEAEKFKQTIVDINKLVGTKTVEFFKKEFGLALNLDSQAQAAIGKSIVGAVQSFSQGVAQGGKEGATKAVVGVAKAAGDLIGTAFAGLPLGEFIGPFIELAAQGADAVKQKVTSFFAALPDVLATLQEGLNAFPIALIQAVPAFIQSLISSIPRLLNSMLSQGPMLLQAIMEAIPQIITALVEQLPEVLIAFLDSLPTIVEGFIFSIIDQIPILIESLISAIPRLTQNLITQIPIVVARIISAIPRIAINMITELVKLFPMMVTMLVKNLIEQTPKLIVEIVKSMGDAIVKILSDFFGGIGSEKGFLGTGLLSSEGLLGIKGIPILQEGGMVRGKGSQHGLAAIQAGEFVVDRADTSRLVDFLNQNDRIGGLDQVIQRLEEGGTGGGVIQVNVMVGEEQLAQTLVNLNKQGFRTA